MSQDRLDELYALLEVPRDADEAAIKKAYRRLVLKYHPDKNPDDREAAGQKIRALNSAYETLGNVAKRAAYEAQAKAMAMARSTNGPRLEFSTAAHRRVDVRLPKVFLLCPMGQPDKFLRHVDQTLVFHSREDVRSVGFDDFFSAAKFSLNWLPELNNPDRLPKFGVRCMLLTQPGIINGVGGAGAAAAVSQSRWLSFGLTQGFKTASDIMLSSVQDDVCSNVKLIPSPDFPKAYRFEAAYFPGHFLAFDPPAQAQMTGTADPFAVTDFVVADVAVGWQFQTLDEVLVPVVAAMMGGTSKYVKLSHVCQDLRVRTYFQNQTTMGNRIWDFNDFEIYFHAHWETWDYQPAEQCLRLRGSEEEAAAKKAAKRSQATQPGAKKRSKVDPPRFNMDPTRVLLLTNLVGAGEVDEDLEEETTQEAAKYGALKSCVIKELKGVPDEEAVRIFLEFEEVEAATKGYTDMSGRYFGGRRVKALFYDEERFRQGEYEYKDL